jgi:hypothetical protein
MAPIRLIACFMVLGLAMERVDAQTGSDALKQELEGIRATQKLLDEAIETAGFQSAMPFADFLAALEKRVASKGKLALRIDADAFGKKLNEIPRG